MIRDKTTQITPQVILSCIKEHEEAKPRLEKLYNYYKGKHDILNKRKSNPSAPNNKLVAPNPYYIVTVANGFTFANPLTYKSSGNIDNLIDENRLCSVASHDSELGEDLSIYGRAYELVYMSKLPKQHVKLKHLSPIDTFVVYAAGIDHEPMFAVYYYKTKKGYEINVYDKWNLYVFECRDTSTAPTLSEQTLHYAGDVPIIEYKNNDEGLGDFERVLTLIDAYDRLQSDRIDDKDQFIDALLVVYGGMIAEDSENISEVMKNLKMYRIIQDLPEGAKAEYLKKALDETSVEVLRNSLKSDISKFSLVPELTDENFAGNASGISMEFKTLGLQWLSNIKRRMFKKSLDYRLQVMNSYMAKLGRGFDTESVDVVFSDTLPVDIMSYLPYAERNLSQKTIISHLADKFGVTDVEAELVEIEKEKQTEAKRNATAFNGNQPFGM